jgi:ABC-2 type transport system permease protein
VYRLVWRQTLFFVHNLVIWGVLMIIFPQPLGWSLLLAIPAFALLVINGAWIAVLAGIIATRFRDIPPIIASLTQLLFFMTPIVWVYDDLLAKGGRIAERARFAEFNPFLHFIEIIRRPMLGQSFEARYWIVTGIITGLGWLLALLFLRNYRARVSYWV